VRSIVPEGMQWYYDQWHFSPLVLDAGFGFITGVTGTRDDGSCAEDPEIEFTDAFDKLERVLRAGNLSLTDIVEMTTFHVDLQAHIDVFRQVHGRYLSEPWPAWSAIGTTELVTPGSRLEIKVICRHAHADTGPG
jgi:enamine deaminase RidA (YjgF/YER057c/UK114 family)